MLQQKNMVYFFKTRYLLIGMFMLIKAQNVEVSDTTSDAIYSAAGIKKIEIQHA